jgi:hypothetical protein
MDKGRKQVLTANSTVSHPQPAQALASRNTTDDQDLPDQAQVRRSLHHDIRQSEWS